MIRKRLRSQFKKESDVVFVLFVAVLFMVHIITRHFNECVVEKTSETENPFVVVVENNIEG